MLAPSIVWLSRGNLILPCHVNARGGLGFNSAGPCPALADQRPTTAGRTMSAILSPNPAAQSPDRRRGRSDR